MNFDKQQIEHHTLNPQSASNLSHVTKSLPMMEGITPRWLLNFLPWVSVEAGIYRVNKIKKHDIFPEAIRFDNNNLAINSNQMSQIPFLKNMNPEIMDNISSMFTKKEFDSGNMISEAEAEAKELMIVAKGKIEVTTIGLSGERLNVDILSTGDYTNLDAFVNNSKRPIYIKALTPCTLFCLERKAFDKYFENSPNSKQEYNNALENWLEQKKSFTENGEKLIDIKSCKMGEYEIPETYPDYEEHPREYMLHVVHTILKTHSHITDIFNSPINQIDQQIRLTIEAIRERQEWELINNKDFGLINNVSPIMKVYSPDSAPTPDAMDELLSKVWKKPAFFLAHPKAIAAFGRECTKRGVPPATANMYGSPFITWRGVPIVPCDKLMVNGSCKANSGHGATNILLMRVGEKEQGVIGLHQPGIPNETSIPSLSMNFAGIDNRGISSYILSMYFSAAVLTNDAIGMLENIEVGKYYE
ncbi:MAG: family 2B encapsulin nanocompartment shell protein [Bacillota bacterium]|nr:family 2B encapsulin nanocompartment shell protein [Bacillota bacterium]